jgi:hypothetical protein
MNLESFNNTSKKYLNSTLFKLILFSIFILFFYNVISDILLFFGIETTNVYLYLSWLMFILLLVVIMPATNGVINKVSL